MNCLLRVSFGVWVSVALVGCQTAGSAGNALMSTFGTAGRVVEALGRTAGLSAAVTTPDTSSNAVADRGKLIEARGEFHPAQISEGTKVAQR